MIEVCCMDMFDSLSNGELVIGNKINESDTLYNPANFQTIVLPVKDIKYEVCWGLEAIKYCPFCGKRAIITERVKNEG